MTGARVNYRLLLTTALHKALHVLVTRLFFSVHESIHTAKNGHDSAVYALLVRVTGRVKRTLRWKVSITIQS